MASTGEREFQPIRTENILNSQPSRESSNDAENAHRPSMIPSHSSTDIEEKDGLERTQTSGTNYTSRSAQERRQFEPIRSGDREELHRIASSFAGSVALQRTMTVQSSGLERKDTLAGIQLGDAVLDPSSPEFDVYKWSRM
jgi:ATP-binding cassette, subfamily G (WHITE), member 2, PDR